MSVDAVHISKVNMSEYSKASLLLKFFLILEAHSGDYFLTIAEALPNINYMFKKISMKLFENDLPDHFVIGDEVAIDTETMGLKPHRDRLCVVQLSNKQKDVTLIRFKDGKFKAPNLVKILNNPKILKIFHYARFDIATILHHIPHVDIQNIFCTKIASHMVRTYTDRHGLKALVKELLGIDLDKSEQTSYWGAEELTEKQKEYAAADVIHLCRIKDILTNRLKREGRYELALECFEFLQTRAKLDLLFGEEVDVFSYKLGKA